MGYQDSWVIWLISFLLVFMARLFGVDNRQGSMALVYVATAPECGPDPEVQGGGSGRGASMEKGKVEMDERGKGGGRYFNRIWEEEGMPHCRDRDARLRVWRKVDEELKLSEKGLLDVLGLYSGEVDED